MGQLFGQGGGAGNTPSQPPPPLQQGSLSGQVYIPQYQMQPQFGALNSLMQSGGLGSPPGMRNPYSLYGNSHTAQMLGQLMQQRQWNQFANSLLGTGGGDAGVFGVIGGLL